MGLGVIYHVRRGAPRWARAVAGVLALACVLGAAPAFAQVKGTAQADAMATVLTPGSIEKTYDMDFGRIAQNATGGTVVLSAANNATCTVSGGLIRTGACRAATFAVYGKRNWNVRAKSTQNFITLNGPNGATMQVTNLSFASQGLLPLNIIPGWDLGRYNITDLNGFATFWLGGRLNVGAAQAPGVYRGTVVIQVQFN